jgi:hypothetical protein
MREECVRFLCSMDWWDEADGKGEGRMDVYFLMWMHKKEGGRLGVSQLPLALSAFVVT